MIKRHVKQGINDFEDGIRECYWVFLVKRSSLFLWNLYILTGVDLVSRYKVAKRLRTKKATDVVFLLKNNYECKANPLKWPEVFQCDNGSEFKAGVKKIAGIT